MSVVSVDPLDWFLADRLPFLIATSDAWAYALLIDVYQGDPEHERIGKAQLPIGCS